MKRVGIVIALVASVGMAKGQEMKTALDSAAYVIGSQFGEQLFLDQIQFNADAFFAGFKDGYSGGKVKIQEPQKTAVQQAFQMYIQQKQQEKVEKEARFNAEVAKGIMEKNRQNKNVKETESGLQYEVIKEGKGAKPLATDKVEVHYVGKLYDDNGTKFDSSRDRGESAKFGLNQVIRGWTEGLQLMSEGSIYKFWIPAELAYGSNPPQGSGIPAGAMLMFEVELIKIINP